MMIAVSDESVWGAPGAQPGAVPPTSPPTPPPGAPGHPMPGPPGPVPPVWQPPVAPGSTQRRTLRRGAMTVIIIVALLGVGSCGALILGGVRLAKGPIKATDSYFSAIKRGDVEAAFARQCPSLQATATPTALRDAYDTDPVISWHTRGFQDSTDFNGNTVAVVSGTLTRQDGAQLLDVQLEKDGRDWLVCGGVPQPR